MPSTAAKFRQPLKYMRTPLKFLPLLLVALVGCRSDSQPAIATNGAPADATADAATDAATPDELAKPDVPARTETALDRYIARPEKAYQWADAPELVQSAGETDLRLTSQTWQGKTWTHRVQIFTPQKLEFPDAALINVSYGSGSFAETFAGQALADATGTTVVNLFDVPNQPLFDKTEDDLIAYTFAKYLGNRRRNVAAPVADDQIGDAGDERVAGMVGQRRQNQNHALHRFGFVQTRLDDRFSRRR